MNIKQLSALIFWGALVLGSCCRKPGEFSKEELALIHNVADRPESDIPEGTMRVLTIDDPADCLVLRAPSSDLSAEALLSSDYEELARLMIATVTHPSQDGVGIAGPQVGLNRRVVAVRRFDKEPVLREGRLDHPFEVYPNIRIVWASDSLAVGPEGCLSVPDRRGDVLRSTEIVIEYASVTPVGAAPMSPGADAVTDNEAQTVRGGLMTEQDGVQTVRDRVQTVRDRVQTVRDTVRGFTAVIFQHEIDHLDGILYIDRL